MAEDAKPQEPAPQDPNPQATPPEAAQQQPAPPPSTAGAPSHGCQVTERAPWIEDAPTLD